MIRMFLTPRTTTAGGTARRQKSDHVSVEAAQMAFAEHPERKDLEAIIYVDGTPSWVGTADANGRVSWQIWKV